jgi:hypothetical protein
VKKMIQYAFAAFLIHFSRTDRRAWSPTLEILV